MGRVERKRERIRERERDETLRLNMWYECARFLLDSVIVIFPRVEYFLFFFFFNI